MANWKVTGFEVKNQSGLEKVCVKAQFEVSDVKDGKHGFVSHEVLLGEPNPANFLAYSSISQEVAVGWVKAALEDYQSYERAVAKQIEMTSDAAVIAPPWSPKWPLPVPKR
jgi:hypothetical protein